MKKLIIGLFVALTMGSLSSCKESSKDPAPAFTSVPLIFPKLSTDVSKSYFDTQRARASNNELATLPNPTRPTLEFTLELPDQRDVKIQSVEVYKSFKRGNFIGPRAFSGSYSSFPATVSLTSEQALAGLQQLFFGTALPTLSPLASQTPATVRNPILSGDIIIFTFEYVLEDGSRIILTPLSDVRLNNPTNLVPAPTAKVISGNQINAPYALYAKFQVL